jgi:hypothetical protein
LEEQEMPHIVASVSIVKIMKSYMFPRVSIWRKCRILQPLCFLYMFVHATSWSFQLQWETNNLTVKILNANAPVQPLWT